MPTWTTPADPDPDRDLLEAFPIASTPLGKINLLAEGLTETWLPRGLLGREPVDTPARVGYVRNMLLLTSTPLNVRDEVWRHIAGMARHHRGAWNLFALGVAYPGLRRRARRLTPPPQPFSVVEEAHMNLAAEFLLALHRLPLDRPNIASRLLGAAYDHASGRKHPHRRDVDIDSVGDAVVETTLARDRPPTHTSAREPHHVLRQLVNATRHASTGLRLTTHQAALIRRTYLDGQPLSTVAADLGITVPTASRRRTRAAAIIATLLGQPHLAAPHPGPRGAKALGAGGL